MYWFDCFASGEAHGLLVVLGFGEDEEYMAVVSSYRVDVGGSEYPVSRMDEFNQVGLTRGKPHFSSQTIQWFKRD